MTKIKEFAVADGHRVHLTNRQRVKIRGLYENLHDDLEKEIKAIELKQPTGRRSKSYLRSLQKELKKRITEMDYEIEKLIRANMEDMAVSVLQDNNRMLLRMGFEKGMTKMRMLHVAKDIVEDVASGRLYDGKWSLSSAIWGDSQIIIDDINLVVANGITDQKSTYDIAKDLEKYVDPSKRKAWDWSKVYPTSKKVIDYSAQRLARTMVSHAYAESFVRSTKDNPFVESYRWLISNSDRVCPLCRSRANKIYKKDELPLDHPNGMCTFEAVIPQNYKEIGGILADWTKKPIGSYPEIDKFAKSLGYKL